jgi:hypothetical protein
MTDRKHPPTKKRVYAAQAAAPMPAIRPAQEKPGVETRSPHPPRAQEIAVIEKLIEFFKAVE